jgi:dTDP-4-dehydrorhamnose reductase
VRLLLYGAAGHLGREIVRQARAGGHEVYAEQRKLLNLWMGLEPMPDLDVVINCAAVVRRKFNFERPADDLYVNGVMPWRLAAEHSRTHFIQVSTDSVFSGRDPGELTIDSRPDPGDLHDRSKLLGEVTTPNATVVRTTHVNFRMGLLAEAIAKAQRGEPILGYVDDVWRGSHTRHVAAGILRLAQGQPRGVVHLATAHDITKFDLLTMAFGETRWPVEVCPAYRHRTERRLKPSDVDCALPHFGGLMTALRDEWLDMLSHGEVPEQLPSQVLA